MQTSWPGTVIHNSIDNILMYTSNANVVTVACSTVFGPINNKKLKTAVGKYLTYPVDSSPASCMHNVKLLIVTSTYKDKTFPAGFEPSRSVVSNETTRN